MRFIDNNDGTVTDTKTGLMWVKSPDDMTTLSWQEAIDYSNSLTLAGYSDWRLPSKEELQSLINKEQSNTAEWLNTQGFSRVRSECGIYWSSSIVDFNTDLAWSVDMWNGHTDDESKIYYFFVLPVRKVSK